jgi:hypothetical protein
MVLLGVRYENAQTTSNFNKNLNYYNFKQITQKVLVNIMYSRQSNVAQSMHTY